MYSIGQIVLFASIKQKPKVRLHIWKCTPEELSGHTHGLVLSILCQSTKHQH